jgi:hypothetical protein
MIPVKLHNLVLVFRKNKLGTNFPRLFCLKQFCVFGFLRICVTFYEK